MCRWAGAAGADANWVSVDHVTVAGPGDVTVVFIRTADDPPRGAEGHTLAALGLHPPAARLVERTVRLAGRAADEVAAVRAAAVKAGDYRLLGGGSGAGVRRQRISAIFRPADPRLRIDFTPVRARYWLPTMRTQVKASTWDSYMRNLRLHVVPRLGHRPLQQLSLPILNGLCTRCSSMPSTLGSSRLTRPTGPGRPSRGSRSRAR